MDIFKTDINGKLPFVLDDLRFIDNIYRKAFNAILTGLMQSDGIIYGCQFSINGSDATIQEGAIWLQGEFLQVPEQTFAYNASNNYFFKLETGFLPEGNKTFGDNITHDTYEYRIGVVHDGGSSTNLSGMIKITESKLIDNAPGRLPRISTGGSAQDGLLPNAVVGTSPTGALMSCLLKTAFNKDFGTGVGQVSEGNHRHSPFSGLIDVNEANSHIEVINGIIVNAGTVLNTEGSFNILDTTPEGGGTTGTVYYQKGTSGDNNFTINKTANGNPNAFDILPITGASGVTDIVISHNAGETGITEFELKEGGNLLDTVAITTVATTGLITTTNPTPLDSIVGGQVQYQQGTEGAAQWTIEKEASGNQNAWDVSQAVGDPGITNITYNHNAGQAGVTTFLLKQNGITMGTVIMTATAPTGSVDVGAAGQDYLNGDVVFTAGTGVSSWVLTRDPVYGTHNINVGHDSYNNQCNPVSEISGSASEYIHFCETSGQAVSSKYYLTAGGYALDDIIVEIGQ